MSKLFSDYEEDFKKAFRLAAREPSNHASTNLQPIRDAFREGFSLQEQSKWTEAVKVFEECIENHEKVLGRDHELMVGARNYLARCYVEIGRYSDALSLWTICENISMKSLGPTNPITLQFTSSLCAVLIDLGKWSEAKEKEEAFLHTLEKIQEPDSFRVLGVVVQLGMIYINLGQYDLAIAYHERALSGLQKTMGFNNIETIHAQFKLGAVYAEMGDMHKAANIYEQNRDVCASTRGITNEVYLRSAVNLGSVQRLGGNDIEAEKTLRSLLPVTGPDRKHRYWQKYIGRAADELMKVYMNSGRHDDVRRVQAWVQGDAKALLEIRAFEADQNNTPTWSPRVGDEDEVSFSLFWLMDCNVD
jgi:tetratricopeptide (TPR) repeat protein